MLKNRQWWLEGGDSGWMTLLEGYRVRDMEFRSLSCDTSFVRDYAFLSNPGFRPHAELLYCDSIITRKAVGHAMVQP